MQWYATYTKLVRIHQNLQKHFNKKLKNDYHRLKLIQIKQIKRLINIMRKYLHINEFPTTHARIFWKAQKKMLLLKCTFWKTEHANLSLTLQFYDSFQVYRNGFCDALFFSFFISLRSKVYKIFTYLAHAWIMRICVLIGESKNILYGL